MDYAKFIALNKKYKEFIKTDVILRSSIVIQLND